MAMKHILSVAYHMKHILKKYSTHGGDLPPRFDTKDRSFSLPQGQEKATNPGYTGHATDDEGTPTDAYHAANVSGPRISY